MCTDPVFFKLFKVYYAAVVTDVTGSLLDLHYIYHPLSCTGPLFLVITSCLFLPLLFCCWITSGSTLSLLTELIGEALEGKEKEDEGLCVQDDT